MAIRVQLVNSCFAIPLLEKEVMVERETLKKTSKHMFLELEYPDGFFWICLGLPYINCSDDHLSTSSRSAIDHYYTS
jgi:hypothetical protein